MNPIQDYYLIQDSDGLFDLVIDYNNACFKGVSGFDTAFLIQLFLDKRTSSAEGVSNPRDRGGWIGDIVTKQNNYEIGGKLYLKFQSRNTQNDLNEVVLYSKASMSYFVQKGYAKQVTASLNGNTIIGNIIISGNLTNSYAALWKSVGSVNN